MLERIVCLVIGYVLGLFQTSYIYGRKHGIDIREHGSGNAGTTNAFRTMGKKAGALTLLGDILKCVLAMTAARLLFGNSFGYDIRLLELYAGAGFVKSTRAIPACQRSHCHTVPSVFFTKYPFSIPSWNKEDFCPT